MGVQVASDNCRVIPSRITVTTTVNVFQALGYTQIVGVRLVNFHATSTPIVQLLYKPENLTPVYYLHANRTMPVGEALWFPFDGFGCKLNDVIQVQASIANCIDAHVFIAEIPGRSG